MATTESIEGMIGTLWYHYDVRNDVLYIRHGTPTDAPAYGEESEAGFVVLRSDETDAVVGITVVGWWKRFGAGVLPDSLREITTRVESTTRSLPLAA